MSFRKPQDMKQHTMAIIGIAVGVVSAGTAIYTGARQKSKAKKALDEQNKNAPHETISPEVMQNKQLAELRSKTGLPSEQYALSQKNIQRQQFRALRGANDRRMGLDLIPSLSDSANQQQGRLDAENANARVRGERQLIDVNNQVGNIKRSIFDRDVRQVWNRDFDYNMGLMGAGNQNISNGINSAVNLAGAIATKGTGGGTTNALFGGRGTSGKGFGIQSGGGNNDLRLDDYGNRLDRFGNIIN